MAESSNVYTVNIVSADDMEKLSRALEIIALNWFARNMPVSEPEGLKVGDKIESDQYSGYEPSLTQHHLACQSFGSNLALMYISRWYIRIYTHIYTSYNLLHSSISETKKYLDYHLAHPMMLRTTKLGACFNSSPPAHNGPHFSRWHFQMHSF